MEEPLPSEEPPTQETGDTPDLTPPSPFATPPPDSPTPSLSIPATSSEILSADDAARGFILKQNTAALEAQVEDRPLARKQEELEEQNGAQPTDENGAVTATNGSPSPQPAAPKDKVVRNALLTNNDTELQRVQKVCSYVTGIVLAFSPAPH